MGTVTKWVDGLQTPELLANEEVKVENIIDFGEASALSADVVQVIKVPAGAFVTRVGVLVITAESGVLTTEVGDETDPNGWDDSVNLNSLTGGIQSGPMYVSDLDYGTDEYGEGKYYSSADTIDFVLGNDADKAKCMVWAEMKLMENVT